jgi:hypothetical protein
MYEDEQLVMMRGWPAGAVGGRAVTASLYSMGTEGGSGSGSVDEPEERGDAGSGLSEVVAAMVVKE